MITEIWRRVKPWWIPVGLTLLFYVLLRCVFLIGYVPSASMEPTLPEGSIIFGLRFFDEPEAGDVIVFERDGILMVKRIAAVGGDEVDLTKLIYMDTVAIPVRDKATLTVPEGSYFVLGDNTKNSVDSRYWNDPYVKAEDIVAHIILFSSTSSISENEPGESKQQQSILEKI